MNGIGKLAAAAGLGLAFWVAPALAQTDVVKPVDRPGPPPRCGERLVRSLELTAEQQAALDALQEETAEAIHPVLEQMHALREEIDDAASKSSADPCAVGAMAIEAAGLHAKVCLL